MDKNGDGVLSERELASGIRELTGRGLPDDNLQSIIDLFDRNGDNAIDYREFCDIFEQFDRSQSTTNNVLHELRASLREYGHTDDAALRRAFEQFDANGDGVLTKDEFQRGLRRLEPPIDLDRDQMDELMRVIDADGDGAIDLNEFLRAATPSSSRPSVGV